MGDLTGRSLHDVLLARAESAPDRVFALDVDGRILTYREAVDGARQWAAAYRGVGVARGDIVVTMRLNSIDGMLSWLGLSSLGASEAPVNTDYRGALLAHVLALTKARVAVVDPAYADRFAEVDHCADLVTDTTGFLAGAAPGPLDIPAPSDLMGLLFTSGTTGPSKAVRIPWAQLHATATGMFPIEDLGPDDVVYNPGPSYHVGAKAFPFLAALIGGRVLFRPYLSFSEMGGDYLRFGVTTGLPPVGWLAEPASADDEARPLRNALAPTPIPGLDELKRRFGCRSFGCYNMTELSCPIVDPTWDAAHVDGAGRMSCGRVRPGYEVRLVDEHDIPVPAGEVGELLVRAAEPWVLNAGYLGMPEETAAAWRNGWFHTGDAFVRDDDGRFYFVDRIKDCIRRKGENISSFEVEGCVNGHEGVRESAAVAVRMADGDEEVKAVVVVAPDGALTPERLVRDLAASMPRFMVPRFVEFVDELPRTPTGKVRKAELRDAGVTAATWDREAAGVQVPRERPAEL